MNRKWVTSILLPLIGMLVVLAIAYGFEILNETFLSRNAQLFNLTLTAIIIPWTVIISLLISSAAMILLFWFVMTCTSRSRLVGIIFIVIGFFLVTFEILYNYAGLVFQFGIPFYIHNVLAPNSLFTHIAGGVMIIGLFILVISKKTP